MVISLITESFLRLSPFHFYARLTPSYQRIFQRFPDCVPQLFHRKTSKLLISRPKFIWTFLHVSTEKLELFSIHPVSLLKAKSDASRIDHSTYIISTNGPSFQLIITFSYSYYLLLHIVALYVVNYTIFS